MIETKKIIEAAERHLEGSDMFVVECTSTPGNEIELTIDSDTSVGIDACAELSRAVEAQFDRDENSSKSPAHTPSHNKCTGPKWENPTPSGISSSYVKK